MGLIRILGAAMVLAAAAMAPAGDALAHHPMGGATPTSFLEGLLSGIGHPILGLDHLAAVLAAGCVAASLRNGMVPVLAYVMTMLAGAGLHAAGMHLPVSEILAALAVIALGAVLALSLLSGLSASLPVVLLFAGSGLIHGHVLGESIVGAEVTPLLAYFLGLALVQSALAIGVMALVRAVFAPAPARPVPLRAAGALTIAVGVWFLAQHLAGAA